MHYLYEFNNLGTENDFSANGLKVIKKRSLSQKTVQIVGV